MRRFAGLLAISGVLLAFHTTASLANPLKNTDEVAAALLACWKPPARSEGSFVTLRFSFRRDGTIFGRPLPIHINVIGDENARRRFIDAAINAVERCAPLDFSPDFALGIGGQVFTMRFAAPRKRPTVPERYAAGTGTSRRGSEELVCFAIADPPPAMLTNSFQAGMM
jgi:hypothetical protein